MSEEQKPAAIVKDKVGIIFSLSKEILFFLLIQGVVKDEEPFGKAFPIACH